MDVKPGKGQTTPVSAEQRIYARWLDVASRTGLAVLVVTFLAYAFGLAPAHVPLEELPSLWTLPLEAYLERTGTPTGWGWTAMLPRGEFLSLVGVVMLALATLLCYLRIVVALVRNAELVQAGIAAAQIAVLAVAAAGVISGGH